MFSKASVAYSHMTGIYQQFHLLSLVCITQNSYIYKYVLGVTLIVHLYVRYQAHLKNDCDYAALERVGACGGKMLNENNTK